jgi:hypothetical protein
MSPDADFIVTAVSGNAGQNSIAVRQSIQAAA